MNTMKHALLFIFCLMQPVGAWADAPEEKQVAEPEMGMPAEIIKKEVTKISGSKDTVEIPAEDEAPEGLVIGKNLKVGMLLSEAIKLLGIPASFDVKRGKESQLDSISIDYPSQGIVLHSLNGKKKVEALEVLSEFKGRFAEGIKMGENFSVLIDRYGMPQSMNASLAKYPEKGMYFSLKDNMLVGVHIFAKNSKILSHQLYKSH